MTLPLFFPRSPRERSSKWSLANPREKEKGLMGSHDPFFVPDPRERDPE